MPLKPPSYIVNAGIMGAPIKYKWDNDLAMQFLEPENVRLYDAIDKSNFRAKMALGAVLTEWIVWRFQGHVDLADALHRIEAAWASVIDPAYTKDLRFNLTRSIHEKAAFVEGPLELALLALGETYAHYTTGSIYLANPVMKQALLARHVIPTKKAFADWLTDTLRRTAEVFPRNGDYDEDTETYDASHEQPVPREFFEPAFEYTEAVAKEALREFLRTLNPSETPYLRSPEETKAQGFKGTPYTL
jgi:hypothetical protein